MLAFYVDHHVHVAIPRGLRLRGIDVITAFEDGRADLDDELLLARSTSLGRVLVTQDQSFLRIGRRWQENLREFPGIVFGAQQRLDIGKTIDYLELLAHSMSGDEMRSQVLYLPR